MNINNHIQVDCSLELAWCKLLPKNCFISCGNINNNYPSMTDIEKASFNHNLSKTRILELESGRYHAKKALSKLGMIVTDIPKSQNSQTPKWPDQIRGSITHTTSDNLSHVAAAVSNSSQINYLGIDAEYFSNLNITMWDLFISKIEMKWLLKLNPALRISIAKKIWCLKEAAIKACQGGDMLGFTVNPNATSNFTEFSLFNHDKAHVKLIGRTITIKNITLALVYA